jgi:nicotinamidase-related amidase
MCRHDPNWSPTGSIYSTGITVFLGIAVLLFQYGCAGLHAKRLAAYGVENPALVLMDVWEIETTAKSPEDLKNNVRMAEKIIQNKIRPILNAARRAGIPIVHALHRPLSVVDSRVHQLGQKVHGLSRYICVMNTPNEKVLDRPEKFFASHDVKSLIYVGFATNICILDRPSGVKNNFQKYKVFVVSDATLGYVTGLDSRVVTEDTLDVIRAKYGETLTADDVLWILGQYQVMNGDTEDHMRYH